MKRAIILFVTTLSLWSMASCKKRVVTVEEKSPQTIDSRAMSPQLQAGQWLGREDHIDPKLGQLKALD